MEAIYSCSWNYGVHWLKETWHLFKRAPVVWLISGLICGLIFIIPEWFSAPIQSLLRWGISFFLMPVLFAGIISMAYQCDQGSQIKVNSLFGGFSFMGSFVVMQLINIGLLMLGVGLFFAIIYALKMPLELIQFMQGGVLLSLGILVAAVVSAFVFFALSWFAPVLIVLGGHSPWSAMKTSLSGCLKSWQAWLVALLGMGLLWIAAFFVCALIGMLMNALGLSAMSRLSAVVLFTPIISIVMIAHTLLVYVAYRDVFGEG